MHHVPDKSCKNLSLLTMQKADVKARIAIIEQQLARLVFSTKLPKLIKLYGKIIKILIFSQSFVRIQVETVHASSLLVTKKRIATILILRYPFFVSTIIQNAAANFLIDFNRLTKL